MLQNSHAPDSCLLKYKAASSRRSQASTKNDAVVSVTRPMMGPQVFWQRAAGQKARSRPPITDFNQSTEPFKPRPLKQLWSQMQLNAKLRATDVKLHINTAWSNSTVCQCVMQATTGVSCFYSILHIGKSAAVQASTSLHNDRQIRLTEKQFCGVNAGKNASQRTSEFVSEGTSDGICLSSQKRHMPKPSQRKNPHLSEAALCCACEAPADPGVEVAGVGALASQPRAA